MNIAYYPGCALHGSSNDYEQSLRACLGALDVQLNEVKDWTCCGATAAHAFNHKLSLALPAQSRASRARRPQTTVRALPALFHATAEGAKSPGWKPTACRVVTDCRGRPARRRTSPESDSGLVRRRAGRPRQSVTTRHAVGFQPGLFAPSAVAWNRAGRARTVVCGRRARLARDCAGSAKESL